LVTFLYTDVEGSTQHWEHHSNLMKLALSQHHAILREAIASNNGLVFETAGDSFVAVFTSAPDALQAALAAQRALHSAHWEEPVGRLKVRMGLHTGLAEMRPDGYYAQHTLSRLARLLASAHGDQVVLSLATQELVRYRLPEGVKLRDLGEHRLKDLIRPEHIYQLVAPGLPTEFPLLKTLDARANNLPRQATSLVGREKEVAAVAALLRKPVVALVTLTGPGGTGKTRLALQAATELLDDFMNGVWFVELATLVEPRLVIPTIAQTLGLREERGTPIINSLKEYLKEKHLLLVLDNFEQVVESGREVSELIAACHKLKVLTTSRIPLHLRGEKEFAVPPLAIPDVHDVRQLPPVESLSQYEAVQLFAERATDVEPNFQLTEDNAPAVAQICSRLDGLPLAIELAAARTRLFFPQALLSELSSPLKLLTGGARDLPTRQQALRNTIEWSYNLLSDEEKQLFRRMAPFSGGRTVEALEAVCNHDGQLQMDVFDGVQSLLDKSLLQQREGSWGGRDGGGEGSEGEPRFWMLETIHEYATEKLGESGEADALYRAHAHYFMRLGEDAEPHLTAARQAEWLTRLEEEHDNIRAALRWARESAEEEDQEVGIRLGGAVCRYWEVRGHMTEGREQLAAALSRQGRETREKASRIERERASRARGKALVGVGRLALRQGDYQEAREYFEEGLAAYRRAGDGTGIATSLNNLGILAYDQGEDERARTLYEESLALRREVGDKRGIAISLNNLGILAFSHEEYEKARTQYEESLAIYRKLGDKGSIATSLNNLGVVAMEQREYERARTLYEESLAIQREVGDKRSVALALSNLGTVAYEQEEYKRARTLMEESLALRREIGDKRAIAISLHNLGNILHMEGEYTGAHTLHTQSVAIYREIGVKDGIDTNLGGLGAAAIGLGQLEKGVRLLGASDGLHEALGTVRKSNDRIPYEQAVEAALAQLGAEELERLQEEGRKMSMEEAIEYALGQTPEG
jgi:predicted ATPase/class 3 adenylate cyclase/uncharacterized protein HemY